jgi:hypothetical protein
VLLAIGLALLALVVTVVMTVLWYAVLGEELHLGEVEIWQAMGEQLLATVLWTLVGFAIGSAVHGQVGALVGTLVWLFVAEPIVWVLLGLVDLDGVADYLPAVTVLSILDTEGENLSFAGTVGMAVVWTAVATVLAVLRTSRKDIT